MSSSEELNAVRVIQRFYEAEGAYLEAGGGDLSAMMANLDPECVLFQPACLPYGGERRGHAGWEAWMKAFARQWTSMDMKHSALYPTGDVVVGKSHVHAVARGTGKHVDWPLLQFFRMRNGWILELSPIYWDTAKLLHDLKV